MLNIIMLSVDMLTVIMLSVVMLNVVMLNVVMLDIIMLSIVAPVRSNQKGNEGQVKLYPLSMIFPFKHFHHNLLA